MLRTSVLALLVSALAVSAQEPGRAQDSSVYVRNPSHDAPLTMAQPAQPIKVRSPVAERRKRSSEDYQRLTKRKGGAHRDAWKQAGTDIGIQVAGQVAGNLANTATQRIDTQVNNPNGNGSPGGGYSGSDE